MSPTAQDNRTFRSLYASVFNPASPSTNHLGDQGSSLVTSVISVTAPASGSVLVVASTVSNRGTLDIGLSFTADVTFTAAVPEPSPLALTGLAGAVYAGVGTLRRMWRNS